VLVGGFRSIFCLGEPHRQGSCRRGVFAHRLYGPGTEVVLVGVRNGVEISRHPAPVTVCPHPAPAAAFTDLLAAPAAPKTPPNQTGVGSPATTRAANRVKGETAAAAATP
jgi:hypothetical protein